MVFVALGFLFQCGKSDDSAKDVDPPLVTLKFSAPGITFNDVSGAVGATYTISASHPPSAGKTVEVTLTSASEFLEVSPTKVTFTPTNYASPQTITVKRANDANGIIMAKITGAINHVITTGTSHDAEFTEFAMMKSTVNVTVTRYIPDSDGDGLIEIWNATMLSNMRYNLAGTSYKTSAMSPGNSSGCPAGGCNGYELMANIDIGSNTSWVPVGDDTGPFTSTFEGNGNTIANLLVNISSLDNVYAGLFGVTGGSAQIRNVGVVSGGVSSSSSGSISYSGGLVGRSSSSLTITNSYFSGNGGVSASASSSSSSGATTVSSGGLVGRSESSLVITNSYFSGNGGVSSSSSSSAALSYSGGLVGRSASLTITNSYFSGSGGVSSSSSSSSTSTSGGLVGNSSGTTPVITNSYWNTDAPQSTDGGITLRDMGDKRARGDVTANPMAVGLTLAQLKATSGTFPDLGDAWDLGTDQQLPAVKRCILDMAGMGCASPAMYGALLNGQR